jgi:hypothetical protein
MLFPLAFKKIAHDAGVFEMTPPDRERLRRIEEYVLHDPMSFDEDDFEEYTPHPWTSIDRDIELIEIAERAYKALDVAIKNV